MFKTLLVASMIAVSALFLFAPTSHSESVSTFVTKEEKIRADMLTISRHLGVTCNECHSLTNFTDASKQTFKVSQEHIKIVEVLKKNGFDGKKGPEATCFMCHRGKLHPDFKEPAGSVAR